MQSSFHTLVLSFFFFSLSLCRTGTFPCCARVRVCGSRARLKTVFKSWPRFHARMLGIKSRVWYCSVRDFHFLDFAHEMDERAREFY